MVHRVLPSINVDVFHCLIHRNHSHGHHQSSMDFALLHVCQRTPITENAFLQDEEALNVTQEVAACGVHMDNTSICCNIIQCCHVLHTFTPKVTGFDLTRVCCFTFTALCGGTVSIHLALTHQQCVIHSHRAERHKPCGILSEAIFSSSKGNLVHSLAFLSPPPLHGGVGCRSPNWALGQGARVNQ